MAEPEPRHYRFQPVAAYQRFLETVRIEAEDEKVLVMVCTECGDSMCDVEDGDTLGILVRTAIEHECAAQA